MEFPAGISGLALMAIAILWLVFFIPSWSSSREFVELEKRMPKMVERNTVPSSLAEQISRLQKTRLITALVFALFLLTSVFSFVSIANSLTWVLLALPSLAVSAGAILLSQKAKKEIELILESLLKRPQFKSKPIAKPEGWSPNPLPKPLIEDSAPVEDNVIELPKVKADLDEIMRRRRVS